MVREPQYFDWAELPINSDWQPSQNQISDSPVSASTWLSSNPKITHNFRNQLKALKQSCNDATYYDNWVEEVLIKSGDAYAVKTPHDKNIKPKNTKVLPTSDVNAHSYPAFMILHQEDDSIFMVALNTEIASDQFEKIGELNKEWARTTVGATKAKLCVELHKTILHSVGSVINQHWIENLFSPAIFVMSKDLITHKNYKITNEAFQFGDVVWLTMAESDAFVFKGVLGANGVYDLMSVGHSPKKKFSVVGNCQEMFRNRGNESHDFFMSVCADRICSTHTISTTGTIKQDGSVWIPSHLDYRGIQIIDKTGGGYASYSDYFRCPQCNVKVIVKCSDTNREDTAQCPQCRKGEIEFPHLVNKGVEEE
tara:strand:- start:12345 stop:13445 length:1101 start_codon:yes stop_codon:yes gene_type:complete